MPQRAEPKGSEPTLSPEDFLHQVEIVMPVSTGEEQQRLLQHARAWATVYYDGNLPAELTHNLTQLEANDELLG